ncbi:MULTISPECIES: methanogen output domain 1-containing protein [unclassified Methylobacterium]|jgi:predicted ArsR family transcriptional regulator|uniref:methanogen output domain 1-containing protein n=1 Tax=unclassified Methylobacterium TaxID=2615210 RepID=UPI000A9B5238|nr:MULTISPECIES: methanogen output domain 1-containing protein [unclassified Methylobacterium]
MCREAVGIPDFENAPIGIDREDFLGMVFGAFAGALEDTVGRSEASGFIALVGMAVSEEIKARYLRVAGPRRLDLVATVDAMIDLKRRLGGDFYVIETTPRRIVLGNRRCPFGDLVKRSPSMCMVTSNVFGHMVAESQGYGRITLADTIARGGTGCRIVIDLDPDAPDEGGQDYFGTGDV